MKIDRRFALRTLGAIPLLGWLDPIRRLAQCDTASHYRAHGDGRSLYKLLRDHIRNGIHQADLQSILGPFKIAGPVDHDYTRCAAPGYPDFPGTDVDRDHYFIEYPMSSWFVRLEMKSGYLVNHSPAFFNDYPDYLMVCKDGSLKDISRPLDEGPLDGPESIR